MTPLYKKPICNKCGRIMSGFVPIHVEVVCYLCDNPNTGEEEKDTNWKDKK